RDARRSDLAPAARRAQDAARGRQGAALRDYRGSRPVRPLQHPRDQGGGGVALGLTGRRGRDYFARRGFEVRYEQVNLFQALQYSHAQRIAEAAVEAFTTGQVDSVYLVYNEFRSVMSQRLVVE